jgi:hypothetical protein
MVKLIKQWCNYFEWNIVKFQRDTRQSYTEHRKWTIRENTRPEYSWNIDRLTLSNQSINQSEKTKTVQQQIYSNHSQYNGAFIILIVITSNLLTLKLIFLKYILSLIFRQWKVSSEKFREIHKKT